MDNNSLQEVKNIAHKILNCIQALAEELIEFEEYVEEKIKESEQKSKIVVRHETFEFEGDNYSSFLESAIFEANPSVKNAVPQFGTLTVKFRDNDNNMVYVYRDVPYLVFAELKAAKSKGSYFNRNIGYNYNFTRESIYKYNG